MSSNQSPNGSEFSQLNQILIQEILQDVIKINNTGTVRSLSYKTGNWPLYVLN